MQKIIPHLWYDNQAKAAAKFYVSVFPDSKLISASLLHDTPSGSADIVNLEILGATFTAISAGPLFKFNPSVSFHVICRTKNEVDGLWKKLIAGGVALMELGAYPFSERYGWLKDRWGLSWQLIYFGGQAPEQRIIPVLMFTEGVCGKAEAAVNFYVSVFRNAKAGNILRYAPGEAPDRAGTVKYAEITLEGQKFGVMDSARIHGFTFNEAVSFMVECKTQAEVDYYWEKLSADTAAEQCGWLKDKFGVSWQVVPAVMHEILGSGDQEKIARVTKAFLQMKKFDIAELKRVAG